MRVKKRSRKVLATLAILFTVVFVPGTRATAGEKVLHSFNQRHGRDRSPRPA